MSVAIPADWLELPEVKAAAADAAGDPALFFERLIHYVDIRDALKGILADSNLSAELLDDLLSRSRALADGEQSEQWTSEAKAVIRTLLARGLTAEQVARLVPPAAHTFLSWLSPRTDVDANREIVRLAKLGNTPARIAELLDCPRSTIYGVLKNAGVEHRRRNAAPLTPEQKHKILWLVEHDGASWSRTASIVGCTKNQVASALRSSR